MSKNGILEQYEGALPTSVGKCFPGERAVFRGLDLHTEFRDADWIELFIFSVTGRRLPVEQLTVLQRIWVYTSYPDARLWCNRVVALTGSSRGTGAQGVAAGLATTEAAVFGLQPMMGVTDFLVRAMARREAGEDLEQIVRDELNKFKLILGYGRPVATAFVDERIPPTLAMMERHGVPIGPHLQLAFDIEAMLEKVGGRRLPMTYATMVMAIPLDFGFTPAQCYMYMQPALMAGMIPCYQEALERPASATFALRCERIEYNGAAPRAWEL